jgi:hypothetical protein
VVVAPPPPAPAPPPPAAQIIVEAPPPPPAPPVEAPPPPAPANEVWVSAHYRWVGGRYELERGHFVRRPRPNARFIQGHWEPHARGKIWIEGHWD